MEYKKVYGLIRVFAIFYPQDERQLNYSDIITKKFIENVQK